MRPVRAPRVALACATVFTLACGGSSAPTAPTDAGPADAVTDSTTGGDTGTTEAGAPITAPDDTWTWVDFPESRCASGTPTGLAINPHAGATELLVYFEGGGSCHDAAGCWGPAPTADNLAGYDATTFQGAKQLSYPALVRSAPGSPFTAMNMVYIPYCTGDLHFGSTETALEVDGGTIETYFWGAEDMDVFLARLVPTFPGTSRVYSLGTSAGGFGSYLNFDRLARAFAVRVDVIDDSGPPLTTRGQSDNSGLFAAWGVVLPSGCNACNSFLDVMKFDRQSQPQSKLGFLSLAEDTVISADFDYSLAAYGPEIESLFSTNFGADPDVATYIVDDDPGHVVESQGALAPGYLPWMTELVNGSTAWTSEQIDGGM